MTGTLDICRSGRVGRIFLNRPDVRNAFDRDFDNDGTKNGSDRDTDNDGVRNSVDNDDDNDGYRDSRDSRPYRVG